MNNLRQIAKSISAPNAYQKLQWIDKGALKLLPTNSEHIFDQAIDEIKRQSANYIAFLEQSKKKYISLHSKTTKKKTA